MQFYKCIGTITNKSVLDRMDDRRELSSIRRSLCFACNGINDPDSDSNYIFASEITEELATLTFGAVVVDRKALDKKMKAFVNAVGLGLEDIQAEETTFGDFRSLLRNASRVGMISDDDEVLEKLRLPDPGNYRRELRFAENLIPMTSKEDIEGTAVKYLLKETLSPEIERIYASKRPARSPGHPVFYLIETDNTDIRREAYRALLSALYANGRLCYTHLNHT